VKIGLGAATIGVVAGVALLLWFASSDDDSAIAADEPVQYLLQVGNEREAYLPLPFGEALQRMADDSGFPSFVPWALPGDRNLRPTEVYVRLPDPVLILEPERRQFGVTFRSQAEEDARRLFIRAEREGFYGPDGPVENPFNADNTEFQPQGTWEFTEAMSGTFEVAYTDGSLRSDVTQYIAWRSGSLYRTTLTISGPEQLTHEQAMAILESVLGQE
jgi:hypothetical protein